MRMSVGLAYEEGIGAVRRRCCALVELENAGVDVGSSNGVGWRGGWVARGVGGRAVEGAGVGDRAGACLGTEAGMATDDGGCAIDRSIEVTLSGANFATDSAELPESLKPQLDDLVRRIRGTPGIEQLSVVGYTDSLGDAGYNEDLSRRRAQAVADYLYERGIDRFMMSVSGRGEANPVAGNDTAAGRAENRRVEIKTE